MPAMSGARKSPNRHKQKTVSFRLPDQVMELMRTLARRNRRTLSGEAQIAFESHLAANRLDGPLKDKGQGKEV